MTHAPVPDLDVICVGNVVADCLVGPLPSGRADDDPPLAFVERVELHLGGSAANTAVGLRVLGARVQLVGAVGRDALGRFLHGELARLGVDTDALREVDAPTSATVVRVDAAGERTFLHAVGANARLHAEDVPLATARARGARALHVGGYFALPALQRDGGAPTAALLRAARLHGLATSLDCVWDASGRWSDLGDAVLAETDVFSPNEQEARALTGESDPERAARALLTRGVREAVVVTSGVHGTLVVPRRGPTSFVPAVASPVVDGTGAGDAFAAGFVAARLRGLPLAACAAVGNAAGALSVRAFGATAGLRGWDETWRLAHDLPT